MSKFVETPSFIKDESKPIKFRSSSMRSEYQRNKKTEFGLTVGIIFFWLGLFYIDLVPCYTSLGLREKSLRKYIYICSFSPISTIQ